MTTPRRTVPLDTPIPGGCPDCNAHQTIRQTPTTWLILQIWHDNTCPEYHRLQQLDTQRETDD